LRVDHIGYLVKDIDKAKRDLEALGYLARGGICYDEVRHADIAFFENGGYVVELVAPRDASSVVWNLLKRNGAGPYHICYETDDAEAGEVRLNGLGFVKTVSAQEAPALGGRKVSFFTGRNTGLIELLEKEKK
jgi:methylmalonyl-CoA/ethylmalonyl-CoA epimerase